MEIQFAKQCGSRHDQLDLCKVCGLTKNIDVTLHELTETASLRTVCSPYISHLQCLEWCRKLAAYGHMGREDLGVAWEKCDRVEALKQAVAE